MRTEVANDVKNSVHIDVHFRNDLQAIYEEIMWLARRPGVTPSDARAWYTHVRSGRLRRSVRRFSGKVSESAVRPKGASLRLEHYKRIQTTLTQLVDRHLKNRKSDPREFIRVVVDFECVHIVTIAENYSAMRAKGNYRKAGIKLRAWRSLPAARRAALWKMMLRGKVSNASQFAPSKIRPHRRSARGSPLPMIQTQRTRMDTITTTLKREFFSAIVDRKKRIEYRGIKPYWTLRLKRVKTPFRLVLRNGMTRPIPVLTVRIDKIVRDRRTREYQLHIGRVLKVEHWDRRKKRPK